MRAWHPPPPSPHGIIMKYSNRHLIWPRTLFTSPNTRILFLPSKRWLLQAPLCLAHICFCLFKLKYYSFPPLNFNCLLFQFWPFKSDLLASQGFYYATALVQALCTWIGKTFIKWIKLKSIMFKSNTLYCVSIVVALLPESISQLIMHLSRQRKRVNE